MVDHFPKSMDKAIRNSIQCDSKSHWVQVLTLALNTYIIIGI